jgi:hypothetical protein
MSWELYTLSRIVIEAFFHAVFQLPLKWEPQPSLTEAAWGDSTVCVVKDRIALYRKGITHRSNHTAEGEWHRWVEIGSPNACYILRSMLPSLAIKSIWMAGDVYDVAANFKSLLMGIGWHGYPTLWWRPVILRFMEKYFLFEYISYTKLATWVGEGKLLRQRAMGLLTG